MSTFYANPRPVGKVQMTGFYGRISEVNPDTLDPISLYRVKVTWKEYGAPGSPGEPDRPDERKEAELFILATCPSRAVGQAEYHLGLERYVPKNPRYINGTGTFTATVQKFGIEGWSDQQF